MDIFGRKKKNESDNPYLGLRQQVLDLKPETIMHETDEEHPVYAALVDIGAKGGIVSLACVIDGTASLYYSNGGGMIGLGHADDDT